MQSKLSVISLLRRSLVLLCAFIAIVCVSGVFASRSHAQTLPGGPLPGTYQVSGLTSASIDPNGPNSLWAVASGYLSWNMPTTSSRELYFNIDIYVDGALFSHQNMLVSKSAFTPTVFSVNAPIVFSTSGPHSLRFTGYFSPDYVPIPAYTGHIPLEWDLSQVIIVP